MKRALLLVAIALAALGCGGPVQAQAARGFAEIKDDPTYDFRAVAPEGVAVAARAVPLDGAPSDLGFWERAVSLRMRELDGYALVAAKDVRAGDGTPGKELVFGHDEENKPFIYRVRIFVARGKLLVVEAGGSKVEMERLAPSVDQMLGRVRLR